MKNQDFATIILVDQTQEEVFKAINNVRWWWSEEIEGRTDEPGAEFLYRYKDVHFSKMKIVEMIPNEKIVWFVKDNYFNFTEDKTEWKGTKIVFEISKKGNKTHLQFTHHGLVPEYECYDACREGWSNYINKSLFNLITTGQGEPNPKEGDGFNSELVKKWKLKAH